MRSVAALPTMLLAGCIVNPVEVCPERDAMITQGVVGLDFVPRGDQPAEAIAGATFTITSNNQIVAMTRSDAHGLYRAALEPGDYRICADQECTDFSVAQGELVRLDLVADFGWVFGDDYFCLTVE